MPEISSVWTTLGTIVPGAGMWQAFLTPTSGAVFLLAFDLPVDVPKYFSYLMLRRQFVSSFLGIIREKEYFIYPDPSPFVFYDPIPPQYTDMGLTSANWAVKIASKKYNSAYAVTLLES